MKPYIIGIAGESGVGKSTISNIIKLFYGIGNTAVISTDDLHKWERSSSNWNTLTHLNPEANNLELGDLHLKYLSQNKYIYRSIYNHSTGCFDPPIKIFPKKFIVNEGLHAFYTTQAEQLTDLKIFINTDETLRTHWKIIRDTEKRGYKYNIVLDTINKRKVDANLINSRQSSIADVIVDIMSETPIKKVGDKHEEVNIKVTFRFLNKNIDPSLFTFIKTYNESVKDFISLSTNLGKHLDTVQESGGNISVKTNNHLIVKASGCRMKDVSETGGYSVVDVNRVLKIRKLDLYDQILSESKFYIGERPSMETGFHTMFKKYVIHTHPIYLTTILCLKNSKQIIESIYKSYDFNYVKYVTPGYELFNSIRKLQNKTDIVFLENHGLIITGDSKQETLNLFDRITSLAKEYMRDTVENFEEFDLGFANSKPSKHLFFPDAVIFAHNENKKEILAANNYININTQKLGQGRFISNNNINKLLNLDSEKYRKNL